MRATDSPMLSRTLACLAAVGALLAVGISGGSVGVTAQTAEVEVPDLVGVWNGGFGARPVNGVNQPWTSENFPVLNERALAFQKVFDEAISPKYDCVPSTPPALVYDPYMMEVVQWPDRVLFRYEKDDQLRTVWLDSREPTPMDYSLQGVSVGHYEEGALHVTTSHYTFDVTGFDDYNGIPSSQMKKVTERYWREGDQLKMRNPIPAPATTKQNSATVTSP